MAATLNKPNIIKFINDELSENNKILMLPNVLDDKGSYVIT